MSLAFLVGLRICFSLAVRTLSQNTGKICAIVASEDSQSICSIIVSLSPFSFLLSSSCLILVTPDFLDVVPVVDIP